MKKWLEKLKIQRCRFTVINKRKDGSIFIGYINGKDFNKQLIQFLFDSENAKELFLVNKNKKLGIEI